MNILQIVAIPFIQRNLKSVQMGTSGFLFYNESPIHVNQDFAL